MKASLKDVKALVFGACCRGARLGCLYVCSSES